MLHNLAQPLPICIRRAVSHSAKPVDLQPIPVDLQPTLISVSVFVQTSSATAVSCFLSRPAKLQHQVDWVQQHQRQEYKLCLRAHELVDVEVSATAG